MLVLPLLALALPVTVPMPPPTGGPAVVHARARMPLAAYVSNADDYPAAALRAGAQGRTAFALGVGADGRVYHCAITGSSGSAALDAASCRIMRARARFVPARDANGLATHDRVDGALSWTLPKR